MEKIGTCKYTYTDLLVLLPWKPIAKHCCFHPKRLGSELCFVSSAPVNVGVVGKWRSYAVAHSTLPEFLQQIKSQERMWQGSLNFTGLIWRIWRNSGRHRLGVWSVANHSWGLWFFVLIFLHFATIVTQQYILNSWEILLKSLRFQRKNLWFPLNSQPLPKPTAT